MNQSKLEEYLQKQLIAQRDEINANMHKGDPIQYAETFQENGIKTEMQKEIQHHVDKLYEANMIEDKEKMREYSADILNCVLFYMINRKLL